MTEPGSPLVYGCNLIIVEDSGRTYAMVCSWATQVSDRYAILCIGAQSETGRILQVGTEFSLNVLLREQLELARLAGMKHSSAVDKLAGVPLETQSGVAWLARAKKRMRCRVERFLDVAPDGATRGILVEILAPLEEQAGEPLLLDEVFRNA
ncbi:MAG: flavin reductase [Candidatus Bipolaricaulis sp.]|nr:flavin reductase [Candidatus Bipolaricaulis sp.]MDD5219026.1 flavin reductase [Candidatus Bipolaricaulis sp.]MDD5645781.1 flavin reductase [Candidatus Bipolaricaulis sp.]